jgi:hypothetical protein
MLGAVLLFVKKNSITACSFSKAKLVARRQSQKYTNSHDLYVVIDS